MIYGGNRRTGVDAFTWAKIYCPADDVSGHGTRLRGTGFQSARYYSSVDATMHRGINIFGVDLPRAEVTHGLKMFIRKSTVELISVAREFV